MPNPFLNRLLTHPFLAEHPHAYTILLGLLDHPVRAVPRPGSAFNAAAEDAGGGSASATEDTLNLAAMVARSRKVSKPALVPIFLSSLTVVMCEQLFCK